MNIHSYIKLHVEVISLGMKNLD